MRNQEAARYARMAALTAGLIVVVVAGVYLQRALRGARARRLASAIVPSEVAQQSANFSYSDVEQGRTVFTIRASHATQFKEQNRALLQDVWITIYGREGDRNDNIHTRECSYEPNTGGIRCQGDVQIDILGAGSLAGNSSAPQAGQSVQVKTRDLTFNRQTGEASTGAPVEFRFPQGQGRGVGASYSAHDSTLRIDHAVEFDLHASDRSGGLPVHATSGSLEVRREDRVVVLSGRATVRQADRELSAEKISIMLDEDYHPQEALAEGHPSIQGQDQEAGGKFSLSAVTLEASLNSQGWLTSLVANGTVTGRRTGAAGTDRLLADHLEFAMLPGSNLVRQMTAGGGVEVQSQQGSDSRVLKTESLRVDFSASARPQPSGLAAHESNPSAEQQEIESAETLAPATIESKAAKETTFLSAKKFVAQFGTNGRLDRLLGHGGVEVRRQIDGGIPQSSSAGEFVVTFSSKGEWDSLEETGMVQFTQGDRQASAARAKMLRLTGLVTLDGSAVLSDSMSRTTAGLVTINQQSGELQASGGIVSTYLATAQGNGTVNLGAGPAHISSDSLEGSSSSGHVTYSGHARLWQGESVLQAEQIEIWRDDKKMEARGQIVAMFPQAPGAGPSFVMSASKSSANRAAPTLWQIKASSLVYWSDQGKAHLEGGVAASSEQGSLESRTLDVFLSPTDSLGPPPVQTPSGGKKAGGPPTGTRELSRALAQGNVVVRQGERRGTAEEAAYTAADQKFVLSGGQPTITDASSDTTTAGRSLTFFVASDTILVDSQEGLRTLTKHRVEK